MKLKEVRSYYIFVVLIMVLILAFPVQAFIHHSVENLWQSLTNQVEEELDRTRVGRELNRVIEDVENVAHIVEEVQGLATLAASATPAGAIVTLAVQYEHDSDQLFDRFQDRIHSLENNNPGGGGGANGQLSETEIAGALQSVLEEPPLPDEVYLGDSCIIDFTNCPYEYSQPPYRSYYWEFSCYVEGVVGKKKFNGLNKATCNVNWLNIWSGNNVEIKFPANAQYATYDWERCPRVLLTTQEQRQFLTSRNNVCNEPIAKHDIGEICAVDYTNCSYGTSARSNANRIGIINHFGVRREYACEVAHGNFALKNSLRDACAKVYVGEIEVNQFLQENPEVQTLAQNASINLVSGQRNITAFSAAIVETLSRRTLVDNYEVIQNTNAQANTVNQEQPIQNVENLGETITSQEQVREVYGRENVINLAPPSINERKEKTERKLEQLGILKNFDVGVLKKYVEGQTLPVQLQKLFGNERVVAIINRNYGKDAVFCIVLDNGVVKEFNMCDYKNFKPSLIIKTSQSAIQKIAEEGDVSAAIMALQNGDIKYEAVGIKNKIKFSIATRFAKSYLK
ncbi:hypothetical protein HYU23_01130 [Candidatus Woesearchaeota archaeon]|nr:hypothetical protein [Candidatus Woesearchaeota archaeon]